MPTGHKVNRVLPVDYHVLLPKGSRALINAESDMELAAETSTGREAVEEFQAHRSDGCASFINIHNGGRLSRRIVGGVHARIAGAG